MGSRYYLTGVQLGLLTQNIGFCKEENEKIIMKILKEIMDEQKMSGRGK